VQLKAIQSLLYSVFVVILSALLFSRFHGTSNLPSFFLFPQIIVLFTLTARLLKVRGMAV
jgi:hypothetical protein